MATLKVPGVTVEEITTLGPSVSAVATAIPAFIGYTKNHTAVAGSSGAIAKPVRIASLKDFESIFGAGPAEAITVTLADTYVSSKLTSRVISSSYTQSANNLYYSLQMFYSNGGGACYIVSVGEAPGSINKDKLIDGLNEIKKVDEPTLLVFPEASNLSTLGHHADVITAALAQCGTLQDRFTVIDFNATLEGTINATNLLTVSNSFRGAIGGPNLKYGAVYFPSLQTSLSPYYTEESVVITHTVTGTPPVSAQDYDGLTLIEIKNGTEEVSPAIIENPGLANQLEASLSTLKVILPPSGAVTGVYAAVDGERGVWKAPANVALTSTIQPTLKLSDADQAILNVDVDAGKSINAIRSFTGKGTLIWGARTLAGNDNEWRYVNVRRLFIFTEESVRKAMEFYVFEPNVAQTWLKVKAAIDAFLTSLWRQGALAGAKPEDAFFVKIGLGSTMTADDILGGVMNVEIGLAAARPAEFIVLKFSQKIQNS